MSSDPINMSYSAVYTEGHKHLVEQRNSLKKTEQLNNHTYSLGKKYYYDTPLWTMDKPVSTTTNSFNLKTYTEDEWPSYTFYTKSTSNSTTSDNWDYVSFADEASKEIALKKKAAKIPISQEILNDSDFSAFPKKFKKKIRKKNKKK